VLTRVANEEQSLAYEIHKAFERLLQHRPDQVYCAWEDTLYRGMLALPHLFPQEREELEKELGELEQSGESLVRDPIRRRADAAGRPPGRRDRDIIHGLPIVDLTPYDRSQHIRRDDRSTEGGPHALARDCGLWSPGLVRGGSCGTDSR
jgi:hypothetical protein